LIEHEEALLLSIAVILEELNRINWQLQRVHRFNSKQDKLSGPQIFEINGLLLIELTRKT